MPNARNSNDRSAWRCRGLELRFDDGPLLMGIVNATPDSFHAASRGATALSAISLALRLADEGADIIDVGGESTRPGSSHVPEEEEAARVVPVIRGLLEVTQIPISVDTCHASVARAALEAGAAIVNDVSAGADPAMAEVVRESGAGWVLMRTCVPHETPGTPCDGDFARDCAECIAGDAAKYLAARAEAALEAGIDRERIALDPGIGFVNSFEMDMRLIASIPQLAALGYPVLAGVSRKRFVAKAAGNGAAAEDRLAGSIAAALACARMGARILRVHDVRETLQALAVDRAIAGAEKTARRFSGKEEC